MLTLWHLCFFSEESLNVCLGMRQIWRRRLHTWSFHTTTEVERYMRCLPKFEFQRSSESFLVYYLHSVLGAFSSVCNTGDPGLIPGSGRSTGEGKGYPLQYSVLENFMDCLVHGVAKSRTRLSDFHFHLSLSGAQLEAVGTVTWVMNINWSRRSWS